MTTYGTEQHGASWFVTLRVGEIWLPIGQAFPTREAATTAAHGRADNDWERSTRAICRTVAARQRAELDRLLRERRVASLADVSGG